MNTDEKTLSTARYSELLDGLKNAETKRLDPQKIETLNGGDKNRIVAYMIKNQIAVIEQFVTSYGKRILRQAGYEPDYQGRFYRYWVLPELSGPFKKIEPPAEADVLEPPKIKRGPYNRTAERKTITGRGGGHQEEALWHIGKRILELGKELNLTQPEVAERAGISRPRLSELQSGTFGMSVSTLDRIMKALGKVDWYKSI